jgi:hypothetical protein
LNPSNHKYEYGIVTKLALCIIRFDDITDGTPFILESKLPGLYPQKQNLEAK